MDTTLIDSIRWEDLEHAYGKAVDAPKELANLLGKNEDDRDDAVNGFLYSSAYHQSTVYSCSASVMKCVIAIIENEDISFLETNGVPLIRELLCFLSICTVTWKFEPEIGKAAFSGRSVYAEYRGHPDSKTANYAKELMGFCDTYANS